MERVAEWLWRRYPRNFLPVALLALLLFVAATVTGAAATAAGVFFREPATSIASYTATALLCQGAIGAVVQIAMRGPFRPVTRWARGEDVDVDVVSVWNRVLRLPTTITLWVGLAMFPGEHLLAVPLLGRAFDLSDTETISVHLAILGIELASLIVSGVGARLLLRPLTRELSLLVPIGTVPSRRDISFRTRLVIAVYGASMASGLVTAVGLSFVENRDAWLGYGSGIAAVAAIYPTYLLMIGVIAPSVRPLRDIQNATARVAGGDYTERLPVVSADEFSEVAIGFNQMQQGLLERESLHAAFGSYVDPALAERLLSQQDSVFEGEDVEVSVFFADVRDFTTYSSRTDASEAVGRLNRLFELAVPIIRDHGGHANKYIGDAVLAVFGTPLPLTDHAEQAVAAAVEIQRALRAEFGDTLNVGIGVNTGSAIAGTIGGGGKLEFTVIGDTVNVASRVEAMTKQTGDPILLTQATVAGLSVVPANLVDRGMFELRGKDQKIQLHGLRT